MFFPIQDPDGNDVLPIGPTGYESCWRFDPQGYRKLVAEDFIVWKKRSGKIGTEEWWPYVKTYLEGRTKRASPLWSDLPGSKKASIDLRELMGDDVFDNPKPVEMVRKLLQIALGGDTQAVVVDFFAGSGTTGHAVMAHNADCGASTRFVLVQLPEPLHPNEKAQQAAANYCNNLGKPCNIAELTKERLRRAAKNVKDENSVFAGGLGFRVFKLDSSNIRAWEPDRDNLDQTLIDHQEHLKADRSEADVLYELLLKLGLDLCVPIEQKTIAGKTLRSIGGGVLIACLAATIGPNEVEPLAQGIVAWHQQLKPAGDTTCVFRDDAFADDVTKTNLAAILYQHGIQNVRSL
jgi:adenine-specific DNA-methyltransferase